AWPAQLALEANLPTRWSPEPIETVSLLLSTVDHLGQTLAALPTLLQDCRVKLSDDGETKQLILHLSDERDLPSSVMDLCKANDWLNHLATFEVLTGGQSVCTCDRANMTWRLVW
ncbi:MAG: hypothetical protein WBG38_06940, partial [Nodosilinea sp.]